MEYFQLFISNRRLLTFGILLTFFSGFGKTFLLSQYIPFLLNDFQLNNTGFSVIYALATIASGLSIIFIGRLIDSTELKKYAAMISLLLIGSTLLLSLSYNLFFLFVAVFGLRLAGQGLMNHICFTVMTRYFKRCRGKAISISILGQALGEGILPIGIVLLINFYGWRAALAITAAIMFVILMPVIFGFLKNKPTVKEKFIERPKKKKVKVKEEWSIEKVLMGNQFYLLSINIFTLPFISTGLMFFLMPLAGFKNWSAEWISVCFIGFACTNLSSSFITGQLIDKIRARFLLPYYMIPFALGISCILFFDGPWAAFAYLSLAGFSLGSGVAVETGVIAETYGIKNIGTVKSVFTTLTILASALGPLAMGLLLDMRYSFNTVLLLSLAFICLVSLNSFRKFSRKHKRIKSLWSIPKVILFRKAF